MKRNSANLDSPQTGNPAVPSKTGEPGCYGHNKPPYEKPQSMGGGGIPTIFFDESLPMTKAAAGSTIDSPASQLPAKFKKG